MLGYVSECEFKLQFEDSFKRFFKPLCFHAMSFVKDADIAKDIVHDVFLTTWTQREKIDFTQPMLPYYLSLTRNRSLNYLDHLKVRARHEEISFRIVVEKLCGYVLSNVKNIKKSLKYWVFP